MVKNWRHSCFITSIRVHLRDGNTLYQRIAILQDLERLSDLKQMLRDTITNIIFNIFANVHNNLLVKLGQEAGQFIAFCLLFLKTFVRLLRID